MVSTTSCAGGAFVLFLKRASSLCHYPIRCPGPRAPGDPERHHCVLQHRTSPRCKGRLALPSQGPHKIRQTPNWVLFAELLWHDCEDQQSFA